MNTFKFDFLLLPTTKNSHFVLNKYFVMTNKVIHHGKKAFLFILLIILFYLKNIKISQRKLSVKQSRRANLTT